MSVLMRGGQTLPAELYYTHTRTHVNSSVLGRRRGPRDAISGNHGDLAGACISPAVTCHPGRDVLCRQSLTLAR